MRKILILAIIGISTILRASNPSISNNVYLSDNTQQFKVTTAIQNTKDIVFYLFSDRDDTVGWDASGWNATYSYSNKKDPSEAIPIRTITGVITGNKITISPLTNEFTTVINNGYAVLTLAKTGEITSYARGYHTTLPAPEITSTTPFQGKTRIDWSIFSYTNGLSGPVIPDGTTITAITNSIGQLVLSSSVSGTVSVVAGEATGGILESVNGVGPTLVYGLTTNALTNALSGTYVNSETDPIFTNWVATNVVVAVESDPLWSGVSNSVVYTHDATYTDTVAKAGSALQVEVDTLDDVLARGNTSPLPIDVGKAYWDIVGTTNILRGHVQEGYNTQASGANSHAEGYATTASGYYSHAEGSYTTASGYIGHAEGYYTTASGTLGHAAGYNTTASGEYSHAEGYNTTASGYYSHAEGFIT